MKAVCIIPARGNSVRIPGKNIKPFHGKPIIEYSIASAFESGLFDEVLVSTDDDAIGDIARVAGAVVVWRARDDGGRGTQEVAIEALLSRYPSHFAAPALTCVLYPCAPLLDWRDLWAGFTALLGKDVMYAYGVNARTDKDCGAFYWGVTRAVLDGLPLVTDDLQVMTMPAHNVIRGLPRYCAQVPIPSARAIDINTPEDWAQAESMFAALRRAA